MSDAVKAMLRMLGQFHHELVVEQQFHQVVHYDPARWSRFSQGWNRRRINWGASHDLHMGAGGVTPKTAEARIVAASIALFEYWTALHFEMDYERTRPKGLARLLKLRTWKDEDVLHDRVVQTAQQYTDLFAEAQGVILGVEDSHD